MLLVLLWMINSCMCIFLLFAKMSWLPLLLCWRRVEHPQSMHSFWNKTLNNIPPPNKKFCLCLFTLLLLKHEHDFSSKYILRNALVLYPIEVNEGSYRRWSKRSAKERKSHMFLMKSGGVMIKELSFLDQF